MTATIVSITTMVKKLEYPPNRLREQRKARGLTLKDVAEALNTTQMVISRFETGERDPNTNWLRKIGAVLGLDVGQLLNAEDNPASLSDRQRAVVDTMRAGGAMAEDTIYRVAEGLQQYQPRPDNDNDRKRA